jgi:D-aminopeptidase
VKALLVWLLLTAPGADAKDGERPRIRDLGRSPGVLPPGPLNGITDVEGVRVGHRTLIRGDGVRTGVTAILPHAGNLFQRKLPAAVHVGNGFGKAAGFLQVQELGTLESPIVLTNTLAVGAAVEAVVAWTLEQPGNEAVRSVNALVGETNDGFLNDIRGLHVTREDVRSALAAARAGPVEEGSVGAGTGTRAFGFKGGIGSASRHLPPSLGGSTVGVLVQSNFDGVLSVDGVPVGKLWGMYPFHGELRSQLPSGERGTAQGAANSGATPASIGPADAGSCMIVVATDAPLSPRNLERMARRAVLGLARTGSFLGNGSGDFVIAFSTSNASAHSPAARTRTTEEIENDHMDPLFLAVVEAVEEAVLNSVLRATSVTGHEGRTVEAIPIEKLRETLRGR